MSPHKSRLFYGYWILTVAFLCLFLMSGFVKYSFSLYVRRLAAEFDWSRAQIMAGSTITGLVMGISALVIGRIIYHYRARKVIATGALVAGCGLALLSLTRELWYFYLVFAVVGAGAAGMGVVVMSTIVSNWFRKRRGWAIGILGTGIGAGGFAMPLFVGVFLIPSFGWRTAYLVSGLLTLLLIVPLSFLVIRLRPADKGLLPDGNENPKDDNGTEAEPRVPETGLSLKMALATPVFWLMTLAFFSFSFANSATMLNQVPRLEDIGFPIAVAAAALSTVGSGSAVGKFGFGWLGDFVHSKYTLAMGIVFQAVAVLILMNITPDTHIVVLWSRFCSDWA